MVPSASIVRPAGNPVAENVYGPPLPPLPVICTGVIATPCTAVIETQLAVGAAAIVMPQFAVVLEAPLPFESVTLAVKGNDPGGGCGVPLITPVVPSSVKPLGSVPLEME